MFALIIAGICDKTVSVFVKQSQSQLYSTLMVFFYSAAITNSSPQAGSS